MAKITFDPEKFQLNLASLKKHGHTFEVVIEPDKFVAFKEGQEIALHEIVTSQEVFVDAQKGKLASHDEMKTAFDTDNFDTIALKILSEGSIHLPQSYKQQVREKRKKQLISIIHTNGVDPRTNAPHPAARIESALDEAKVHVDEFKTAKDQVKDALKKIQPILPIRFEQKEVKITIPPKYASQSQSVLHTFGELKEKNWLSDGSFSGILVIPGGIEEELYSKLNSITHGEVQTEIINIIK